MVRFEALCRQLEQLAAERKIQAKAKVNEEEEQEDETRKECNVRRSRLSAFSSANQCLSPPLSSIAVAVQCSPGGRSSAPPPPVCRSCFAGERSTGDFMGFLTRVDEKPRENQRPR